MTNHRIPLEQFTDEQILWFAELSAGAVMSEGDIQDEKLRRIGTIFNLLNPQTKADNKVKETLMLHSPSKLTPIDFTPQVAKEIYRFILYISLSTFLMGQRSVIYLFESARLLNIDSALMKEMIHHFILQLKSDQFSELVANLPPDAQKWLSAATLQVILANGKTNRTQITHLNHIQELLDFNPVKFKELKESLTDFNVESCKSESLTIKIRLQVFSYLAMTSLLESGFEPHGLKVAKEVATHLSISENQQKSMLNKIKNFALIF